MKAAAEKKRRADAGEEDEAAGFVAADFTAIELYRELVKEKQGEKPKDESGIKRRQTMKQYLKENMQTDQIDQIDF
jgi:hypothetical protein